MASDPEDLRARASRIEARQRERREEERRREQQKREERQRLREELLNRIRELPDDGVAKLADDPGKSFDVPGRLATRRAHFLPDVEAHSADIQRAAQEVLRERQEEQRARARPDGGTIPANAAAGVAVDDRVLLAIALGALYVFAKR